MVEFGYGQFSKPNFFVRKAQNLGFFKDRNMLWMLNANFGDWIGPLLFRIRQGVMPLYYRLKGNRGGTTFVTAGSILRHIKRFDAARVWGTGIISRADMFPRPNEIRAVRGPVTRDRCRELGYDCPEVYGDPAILLPDLLGTPEVEVTHPLGVIPHYVNHHEAREIFGEQDVKIIDVRQAVPDVVRDIMSCEATVSSSLHGLIVSHVYGRPSGRVQFREPLHGDGIKFQDYYAAGGVADAPRPLRIRSGVGLRELTDLAAIAPKPDNERLKAGLLDACPF